MKRHFAFVLCMLLAVSAFASEMDDMKRDLAKIYRMDDDSLKVMSFFSFLESYDLDIPIDQKLKYAQKALNIARNTGWQRGVGLGYYYMAWFYFFDNDRLAALNNFLKAGDTSDDISIRVTAYGTASNIYSWANDHENAHKYAQKGWDEAIADTVKADSKTRAEALIYLGDVFRYQGNKELEKHCYLHAHDVAHKDHIDDPSYSLIRMFIYVNLSDDRSLQNPFLILKYSMSMRNIYEKSTALEKYKTLAFLIKVSTGYISSTYNNELKQVQLDAQAKQKKIYIYGLIILSVLLILVVWQSYSRKKAIDELAKANEMKSRFFGILNHDLRRPVAGLISYLQLKTVAPDAIDPKDAVVFEQKTIDTAKSLLESMEDLLFWCKDQMQSFTPEFVIVPVSKLFDDTRAFFNYDENAHISFEITSEVKIKTDENYVKTIMRNLTSNAIAATAGMENPEIVWRCTETTDSVVLSVTNNGKIMSQDKIDIIQNKGEGKERNTKEGLGLKIVRDLAESIHCDVKLVSNETAGTVFSLIFNKI